MMRDAAGFFLTKPLTNLSNVWEAEVGKQASQHSINALARRELHGRPSQLNRTKHAEIIAQTTKHRTFCSSTHHSPRMQFWHIC